MAYIPKETILAAYRELSNLTSDPSSQGSTQATSSLRYVLALAEFYKRFSRECNTRDKEDRENFIDFVGRVVKINDLFYTSNFFNSIKEDADYKVGSNFFSVNVVKTSLENSRKEYVFPKRGNSPLFNVKNGCLILNEEYFPNIGSFLFNSTLCSAFCIWLVRNDELNPDDFYTSLKQTLDSRYSKNLVSKFLPPKEKFETFGKLTFTDKPASLEISDFTLSSTKSDKRVDSLFSSDALITKVRDSFIRYWQIIDQHGAQFELYVNKYEGVINPLIQKLKLGFSNIFEVVNYQQFLSIIEAITKSESDLGYLNDDKGPDGNKYYIWSTNRHLRNYLEILSVSDFFSNVREQNTRTLSVVSSTTPHSEKSYLRAMRTKPFLLLAGISGTGKSRVVKQMAFDSCPDNALLRADLTSPGNYCLIEVKPNWHDSTELLGYESMIGHPHYQLTSFVKFLAKAMLFPDVPFFVCLDEMNLAPVEQYFAEFLSILESRTKIDGHIVSEPLIKADIFKKYSLEKSLFSQENNPSEYPDGSATVEPTIPYGKEAVVYEILKKEGLRIPENVVVIGTVNMDETTHQFSRKVIDRAMTIEMNLPEGKDIDGNDINPFMDFFTNSSELEYRANPTSPSLYLATETKASDVVMDLATYNEESLNKTEWLKGEVAKVLTNLNSALEDTPFKIAYRVQNELMLYFYQLWLENKEAKWRDILALSLDQILMMKVLPRIEGDNELLKTPLDELSKFCQAPYVLPNSAKKVKEMSDRLEKSQFTSFWP